MPHIPLWVNYVPDPILQFLGLWKTRVPLPIPKQVLFDLSKDRRDAVSITVLGGDGAMVERYCEGSPSHGDQRDFTEGGSEGLKEFLGVLCLELGLHSVRPLRIRTSSGFEVRGVIGDSHMLLVDSIYIERRT